MNYGKCMRKANCKTCYDYNKCGQAEDKIKKTQKKKKRNKGKSTISNR